MFLFCFSRESTIKGVWEYSGSCQPCSWKILTQIFFAGHGMLIFNLLCISRTELELCLAEELAWNNTNIGFYMADLKYLISKGLKVCISMTQTAYFINETIQIHQKCDSEYLFLYSMNCTWVCFMQSRYLFSVSPWVKSHLPK